MDDTKETGQVPAWLLTADRYIAEISRKQRVIRRRAVAEHIKVGQGLPKPFLAFRVDWLHAAAPLRPQ